MRTKTKVMRGKSKSRPSFISLPRLDTDIAANLAQLALLLFMGYYLCEATREGVTYDYLLRWTGITALVGGTLCLLLERFILTGKIAKILAGVEGFFYLFWLAAGYLGSFILDPANPQASLFKSWGMLGLLTVWNILQLVWGVSQKWGELRRRNFTFAQLIKKAEEFIDRQGLDEIEARSLLSEITKISRRKITNRRDLLRYWKSLEDRDDPLFQFLLQILSS